MPAWVPAGWMSACTRSACPTCARRRQRKRSPPGGRGRGSGEPCGKRWTPLAALPRPAAVRRMTVVDTLRLCGQALLLAMFRGCVGSLYDATVEQQLDEAVAVVESCV